PYPTLRSFPTRRSSDLLVNRDLRGDLVGLGEGGEGTRCRWQIAEQNFLARRAARAQRRQQPDEHGERKSRVHGALLCCLPQFARSEEHTSELQSLAYLV